MPVTKVQIAPGFNKEGTRYSAEGQWYDGDKVRFRSGQPEKLGGWARLSALQFLGVCRSLANWSTLSGENLLGVGTNLKYYIEEGGQYSDITPIRKTTSPVAADPIDTAYGALSAGITATATSITLVDASSFPAQNGLIQINAEQMRYSSISGNVLSGVVRGVNATVAASHSAADPVACATIQITDTNHGALVSDFLTISGAADTGGILAAEINQEHQVVWVKDTQTFAIEMSSFSTSAATGGGAAVDIAYQVNTGLDSYTVGLGWGADPWGYGGWGSPATIGIGQQLRLWKADSYGEDLIFNPRGGSVYYWDATLGTSVRGQFLSELSTTAGFSGQFVPHTTNQVVVSPVERFVMLMGANPYDPGNANTDFDPMLVRWSDQDNPFQWAPAIVNQSGEFRLTHGSYIVTAQATRQETLIWSDAALYSAQYLGPPYVWGFNQLAENISVISPNAATTANNVTYWMGADKFYMYSGRVETLPCTLRQAVFADLNRAQGYQVFAGNNERYNEVWWFYCSENSLQVDRYVIYNYLENVWYSGSLSRTAWLDSSLRDFPMAADYNRRILYHETGTDDLSGDASMPISAYAESSDFDIGDGDSLAFVWRMLPDLNFTGSSVVNPSVDITLKPRRNAGASYDPAVDNPVPSQDNYTTQRVYSVQQFKGQVAVRVRGRQMALRIESAGIGVAWQLGSMRFDIKPNGLR
jgi:hypothetical protein